MAKGCSWANKCHKFLNPLLACNGSSILNRPATSHFDNYCWLFLLVISSYQPARSALYQPSLSMNNSLFITRNKVIEHNHNSSSLTIDHQPLLAKSWSTNKNINHHQEPTSRKFHEQNITTSPALQLNEGFTQPTLLQRAAHASVDCELGQSFRPRPAVQRPRGVGAAMISHGD